MDPFHILLLCTDKVGIVVGKRLIHSAILLREREWKNIHICKAKKRKTITHKDTDHKRKRQGESDM